MINKYLIVIAGILSFITVSVLFPEGVMGLFVCIALGSAIIHFIRIRFTDLETQAFLINIFVAALLVRILLAIVIYGFELQGYFGPDTLYYDVVGNNIANYWWGQTSSLEVDFNRSGWGMPFFVGAIYFICERNPFAGQLIVAVLGATTTVLAYLGSREIFQNVRVARYTAIFIAFFPSMVIWTSQMLKDGFIIFFLVLSLLSAIYLQKKFSYFWIFSLMVSLLAISSLRFYIFFMLLAAIGGGFVLNVKTSFKNLMIRFAVCVIIGVSFAGLGVWKTSGDEVQSYISLEKLQAGRKWSQSDIASKSGMKDDVDVSTTGGVVSALPVGLLNLYLAPFPWQVGSLTQVMTMPEMVIWWCSLPFLFTGILYAVRNRLGESISVLFFTIILSLTYAVSQGNLGTLYRQRAQIQVFLLFFIAVGFTLMLEKRENDKLRKKLRQRF